MKSLIFLTLLFTGSFYTNAKPEPANRSIRKLASLRIAPKSPVFFRKRTSKIIIMDMTGSITGIYSDSTTRFVSAHK